MVTVHDRRTEQKMIRAGVFRHSREEMLRVLLLFSDDVTVPDRGGFFCYYREPFAAGKPFTAGNQAADHAEILRNVC